MRRETSFKPWREKIQHNTRRVVRDRRYSIFERIITHKVLSISQVRRVYLVCKIGSQAHLRHIHPPPHNHRLTGLRSLYKKYFYTNRPISPKNGEQTTCLNVLWKILVRLSCYKYKYAEQNCSTIKFYIFISCDVGLYFQNLISYIPNFQQKMLLWKVEEKNTASQIYAKTTFTFVIVRLIILGVCRRRRCLQL